MLNRWRRRRTRICFVMARADGPGGEARTITNLANHLAETHDVELISLLRQRTEPYFPIDPRIEVTWISDIRPFGPDGRRRNLGEGGVDEQGRKVSRRKVFERQQPSAIVPDVEIHWASNDQPLIDAIRRTRADVMIGTRPGLNIFVGRYARRGVLRIGQDHMNYAVRTADERHRRMMSEAIGGLDVFVPLTEGDIPRYRELLPHGRTRIAAIPNALSWPLSEQAPLEAKVVLAAGRLEAYKGFGRLIDAYEPLVRELPDWQLHIHGVGAQRARLAERIEQAGLGEQIVLPGYTSDLPAAMRAASVFALSSTSEGFPMVLVEASSMGVPQVAFDIPTGPADLIRDGVTGRLVPDGDLAAYTSALRALMQDAALRRRLGAGARERARDFELPRIAARWEELFALRR